MNNFSTQASSLLDTRTNLWDIFSPTRSTTPQPQVGIQTSQSTPMIDPNLAMLLNAQSTDTTGGSTLRGARAQNEALLGMMGQMVNVMSQMMNMLTSVISLIGLRAPQSPVLGELAPTAEPEVNNQPVEGKTEKQGIWETIKEKGWEFLKEYGPDILLSLIPGGILGKAAKVGSKIATAGEKIAFEYAPKAVSYIGDLVGAGIDKVSSFSKNILSKLGSLF